jgi:hypothetical protein
MNEQMKTFVHSFIQNINKEKYMPTGFTLVLHPRTFLLTTQNTF